MADRAEFLGASLAAGVAALQAGDATAAVEALRTVAADPELAAATDLADIRARACSLLAQALLAVDEPVEARSWVDEGLRIVRARTDEVGYQALRGLGDEVDTAVRRLRQAQAAAMHRRSLASMSAEALADGASGPDALLARWLEKATADLEAGDRSGAVTYASEALAMARSQRSVRGQVLARLTLARAQPGDAAAQLTEAWRTAERADAFTLVGAVAREAELLGVALPTLNGPQLAGSANIRPGSVKDDILR